jgi:hypothetical protein
MGLWEEMLGSSRTFSPNATDGIWNVSLEDMLFGQ